MKPGPPRSTLFPYTTLFRSQRGETGCALQMKGTRGRTARILRPGRRRPGEHRQPGLGPVAALSIAIVRAWSGFEDRKSTRLNSSHANISYAVFCLKKKTSLH